MVRSESLGRYGLLIDDNIVSNKILDCVGYDLNVNGDNTKNRYVVNGFPYWRVRRSDKGRSVDEKDILLL